jgi:hypothetical protein
MHQAMALQLANGQPLRHVPPGVCAEVAAQIESQRQQSDMHFESIKRILDRDEAGWRD